MDDIVVTQDMIEAEKLANRLELEKEAKREALEALKVNINGIPFDANRTAISNMNAVGTIANWKFNQAVGNTLTDMADSTDLDDVSKAMLSSLGNIFTGIYTTVYKDNKVPWKGADNEIHNVQAETVLESLNKAMIELARTIGVK